MTACIEWPNARTDQGYGTRWTRGGRHSRIRLKVYVHRWCDTCQKQRARERRAGQ